MSSIMMGDFKDLFEKKPDIYLTVKNVSDTELYTTEGATRFNATPHETFELEIPRAKLNAAGVQTAKPLPIISHETLTTLTCLQHLDADDDLVKQIKVDLAGKSSILEMIKKYMEALKGELDNNAPTFQKLRKLFQLGTAPESIEGLHYGIAVGLRTGDLRGPAAEYGNVLGYIWSEGIGDVAPWVGKSFTFMTGHDRRQVVGETLPDDLAVYRGINNFNIIEGSVVNIAFNELLKFMWEMQEASEANQLKYGYVRSGGHFASYRAAPVFNPAPTEVYCLNYRFSALGNPPPLSYLIDEVVKIADGLYLGRVLIATDRWFDAYDSKADPEIYDYQHFGYFLLLREDWNVEAQRLFPHLEMPDAAVTTRLASS